MRQVTIENPVINSPFEEPKHHFRFAEDGITSEVVPERRTSQYFVPIAPPKKRGTQAAMATEWTLDRVEENHFINRVRHAVATWRRGGYLSVTKTTRDLLRYWTNPDRERKLFFCQVEALETAIYAAEVAHRHGDTWIENDLRQGNAEANPDLFRIAFKMATGSGKTVVMAMLISWQAFNKLANPRDARFSDSFLIVTPGITIRDRLRVLLPTDPGNYYRERDVVSPEQLDELQRAKIVITNYHGFLQRERGDAGKLTKRILAAGAEGNAFRETPEEMVRRVSGDLRGKRNIVVFNDEAHHCYRHKVDGHEKLTGDDRVEAKKREEAARVWISGLEAVKRKLGVRVVYDLSATPFFLRGSGYGEGTLFPWVVSDFSLIDAIESGIVKVPRVPVSDDSMTGDLPTYRSIWPRIRDDLPKKGRGTEALPCDPRLPAELEGALHSLYANYEKYHAQWQAAATENGQQQTPPVFIVVCNNTNVSKLVFDYVAGYAKPLRPEGEEDRTVLVPGQLPLFSNVADGRWALPPNTLLIDSEQLESGDALTPEFRKTLAPQIDEFKREHRLRFPERDADALTDEDILREVMNTVGKPGRLGETVRCVVSVSMLTEGWDANTVTHILGVRAFATQLLCEQVVGRGLRRMSYATEPRSLEVAGRSVTIDALPPEYAEVYGVPFSFIPCSGSQADPPPVRQPTRVRALPERTECRIEFPRVVGYRYEPAGDRLTADFGEDSHMALSTEHVPTTTQMSPIVGESQVHTLDDLKQRRPQEVAFLLAKVVLETYFRDDQGHGRPWLFADILRIAKEWLVRCVYCKDNAFPQLLLLRELAHAAAGKIHRALVEAQKGDATLKPIVAAYNTVGSTDYVDFDTTRSVYQTDQAKCHVSHVVADTDSWEQKVAQTLESMPEVLRYVKNHNLGFTIPYTHEGEVRSYIPDFIAHIDDGRPDPLGLIIEVTGQKRPDKETKVDTARTLWVPAINNHGGFGRWAFVEVRDPWNAQNEIREFLSSPRLRGD